MKLIGYYMKMTKRSISLIHAFAHGDRSSDKKKLDPSVISSGLKKTFFGL
jgi:hypothetical protein